LKNTLLFLLQGQETPFTKVTEFLQNDIIKGFTGIAAPIATLAFIGLGIAAMMSTDEHQRQKFKSGLWWTGLAAIICFSAGTIVDWLQNSPALK
jgi:hypothetical protein